MMNRQEDVSRTIPGFGRSLGDFLFHVLVVVELLAFVVLEVKYFIFACLVIVPWALVGAGVARSSGRPKWRLSFKL